MAQPAIPAAAKSAPSLPPRTRIGPYEVLQRIAVGGMAELYLARRIGIEGFEKRVVLKRVLPQLVHDAEFTSMFLNEARLAAHLHHPNVVQVMDIGVVDDEFFFVMEYLHGKNLRRVLREGCQRNTAPTDFAINVAIRMASGLHHAHEATDAEGKRLELVHRDVSPQNVIVTYEGHVKLVDFGIAKAAARRANTQTGTLKGKLGYMAAEQFRGKPIDRRADLFALGVVLYELTVGHRPFRGDNQFVIMNAVIEQDYPRPHEEIPGYPPALEAVVTRLLEADRDKRYSTAEEAQTALEDVAHELGIRVSPSVTRDFMREHFTAPTLVSGPVAVTDPGSVQSYKTAPGAGPDELTAAVSTNTELARSPRIFALLAGVGVAILAGGVGLGVWLSNDADTVDSPPAAAAAAVAPSEDADEDADADADADPTPESEPAVAIAGEPETAEDGAADGTLEDSEDPESIEVIEIDTDGDQSASAAEAEGAEAAEAPPAKKKRRKKKRRKKKKKKTESSSSLFPPSYK